MISFRCSPKVLNSPSASVSFEFSSVILLKLFAVVCNSFSVLVASVATGPTIPMQLRDRFGEIRHAIADEDLTGLAPAANDRFHPEMSIAVSPNNPRVMRRTLEFL